MYYRAFHGHCVLEVRRIVLAKRKTHNIGKTKNNGSEVPDCYTSIKIFVYLKLDTTTFKSLIWFDFRLFLMKNSNPDWKRAPFRAYIECRKKSKIIDKMSLTALSG